MIFGVCQSLRSPRRSVHRTEYNGLGQVVRQTLSDGYSGVIYNPNEFGLWAETEYAYDDRLNLVQVTNRERNFDSHTDTSWSMSRTGPRIQVPITTIWGE